MLWCETSSRSSRMSMSEINSYRSPKLQNINCVFQESTKRFLSLHHEQHKFSFNDNKKDFSRISPSTFVSDAFSVIMKFNIIQPEWYSSTKNIESTIKYKVSYVKMQYQKCHTSRCILPRIYYNTAGVRYCRYGNEVNFEYLLKV